MALVTLGTALTTTLSGVLNNGAPATADIASILNSIKDDQNPAQPIWPGAWQEGYLFIPNRGKLRVLPGDYVAFDSTGWPILLSGIVAASASWVHT